MCRRKRRETKTSPPVEYVLQTSKGRIIASHQDPEISQMNLNFAEDMLLNYPRTRKRTEASGIYNCHGLTFASRRAWVDSNASVKDILLDDRYEEVELGGVLPGDIVVYYSLDGDANHSGVVVEYNPPLVAPIVVSKWGVGGEVVHALSQCPNDYGPIKKFYRCKL